MNNFLRSSGRKVLFALMFIMPAFVVQTEAQINEILNRVEAHRKALSSLRSDILMGKYDPSLNEWTYSKGKIIYAAKSNSLKEGLFRVDWATPRVETLSVIKGKYYLYTPSLKQAYTGEASTKKAEEKGGSVFSFLSMSKAQLNANYSTQYEGEEKLDGGVPTWHLKFIPKTDSKYKNADIWVDGNGMIVQVKIVPKSGDESYVRLTNLEKNITLNTSQFVVTWPKDVKVSNT